MPYAEVLVEITAKKLDKVFHYNVPSVLRPRLDLGSRVVVPFGSRTVGGYVLGFCDSLPEGVAGLKDIIDLAEEEPLLNSDLLQLAGGIAEKYMCSKAEVIRAMMPARVKSGLKYIFPLGSDDLFHEEKVKLLDEVELDAYKLITGNGVLSYRDLQKKAGKAAAGRILKKLTQYELVRVSADIPSAAGPRVIQKISLAEGLEPEQIFEKIKRAPKQVDVINTVLEHGPKPLKELAGLAGVSPSVVRELVKKGYLVQHDEEIRRNPFGERYFEKSEPLPLTSPQASVLETITRSLDKGEHRTFLLHGVTGSGKTEVYLQAIAHCLKNDGEAIVLVPEISLTPQMVERFKSRFGALVAVLHSRLSPGERFDEWNMIRTGKVKVVVGARSAVFAPFRCPKLIIIDEEHEATYKQEDNPKYHAREVAIARARFNKGVVVLGSATPSLESYTRAVSGKYGLLKLPGRVGGRPMPNVTIVDLRDELGAGNRSIFSRLMVEKIEGILERKEQAILFLNRRGHSTFVICRECGLVMNCPKCSVSLTLHTGDNTLRCHYCGFSRRAPDTCPKCSSKNIRHFGIGTQKVEAEVRNRFPCARVARMDMDTTVSKGAHERILDDFKNRRIDILIGTQMIAKGLDFPGVTLVGVVTADTALNLPDFRSGERTFQLLTQVAGRAGRGNTPGEVVVQTYNPGHYSILAAGRHDYMAFYQEEIGLREALEYPPYCSLVRILIYGMDENSVIRGAELLAHELKQLAGLVDLGPEQPILGPAPAAISKISNKFRWQICVKGKSAKMVRQIVKKALENIEKASCLSGLGIIIDVDPVTIL